jgi:hypothetical protein
LTTYLTSKAVAPFLRVVGASDGCGTGEKLAITTGIGGKKDYYCVKNNTPPEFYKKLQDSSLAKGWIGGKRKSKRKQSKKQRAVKENPRKIENPRNVYKQFLKYNLNEHN